MAKQTFTTGQVLTSAQMTALQANDYNWTVSNKTASYVLAAADAGTRIVMNSASATTITVNTALFTASDIVQIINIGAGTCTVTAGTATVTTSGSLVLPQWGSGDLYFTSASASIFLPNSPSAAGTQNIAIFNETQASGTEGGTFTSGAWQKRTLNTTVTNNIAGCSIAASVITLTAGTYYFLGRAPAFNVNGHQLRVQNTTGASVAALGTSMYVSANNTGIALTEGTVTITGSTTFELQHRCSLTVATNGFGAAQSLGSGEVYSQLSIARIA